MPRVSASFRDPSGHVYEQDGRVFRTVTERAIQDYTFVRDQGVLDRLIEKELLIDCREIPVEESGLDDRSGVRLVVEHPRIPFISYPYEWPFRVLQAAALHHLDVQIEALEHGVTLSDGTAYNIQFLGPRPVFIDLLSLRPYREGEYWTGYRQFCEQFLNPLLLCAYTGVAYNAWYRGSPEGVPAAELARVLPWRRSITPKTFAHVILHGRLQNASASSGKLRSVKARKFLKTAYLGILHQFRSWIADLRPNRDRQTVWQDYANNHSYSHDEYGKKKAFVSQFVNSVRPRILWDMGCNSGDMSAVALEAGAASVVGFDFDPGALDAAFAHARDCKLNLLPLYQDVTNPSPGQGWRQAERNGLAERRNADALLALAVIHHLAIGRNIPLPEILDWLVGLAPRGVVEFVPKDDPMVQRMLLLREDIFDDYSYEIFRRLLSDRASIIGEETVSASGRVLVRYDRDDA